MTTHFTVAEKLLKTLKKTLDLKVMLKGFGNNQMMANSWKSHYMLLGKHKPLKVETDGFNLESAKSVKLLGTFDNH